MFGATSLPSGAKTHHPTMCHVPLLEGSNAETERDSAGNTSRFRDRTSVGLEGDGVGLRPTSHSSLERIDRVDLLASELEVEDVEVLGDARGLDRLRNRGATLLQVPAEHHLRG